MSNPAESVIQRFKQWLRGVGVLDSARRRAREGEYMHVFCPHCGEFIPHHYVVAMKQSFVFDGMRFDCPNCDESGVVTPPIERIQTEDGRFAFRWKSAVEQGDHSE